MPEAEAEMMMCMQCEQTLKQDDDREITDNGVLCRGCYDSLAAQVKELVEQQNQDINYPMAVVGAVLGGIVGAAIWWGFTVITEYAFGLVAVVIAFTVAKGVLFLTGGKRSQGLQILAVIVSVISYFYANYLVNRTWIIKEYPEMEESLGFLPDVAMFFKISQLSFGVFTVIFLAIVVWKAWQLVAPVKID